MITYLFIKEPSDGKYTISCLSWKLTKLSDTKLSKHTSLVSKCVYVTEQSEEKLNKEHYSNYKDED